MYPGGSRQGATNDLLVLWAQALVARVAALEAEATAAAAAASTAKRAAAPLRRPGRGAARLRRRRLRAAGTLACALWGRALSPLRAACLCRCLSHPSCASAYSSA